MPSQDQGRNQRARVVIKREKTPLSEKQVKQEAHMYWGHLGQEW